MIKIQNGDIIQIPLPKGLGFAYAKYIDLLKINPENRYPSMIRVYCIRNISEEININDFTCAELLLSPILIGGIQPAIKKGFWQIIGNISVTEDDCKIPDYKYSAVKTSNNKQQTEQWYFLTNADISKKRISDYQNVKHLEPFGAIGTELVGTKIAMALLINEGKNIHDYFELNEFYEKEFYNQVVEIPIFYKQPNYMQGNAVLA